MTLFCPQLLPKVIRGQDDGQGNNTDGTFADTQRQVRGTGQGEMTCNDCPFCDRCFERRGICGTYYRYMERVERTKKDIERINQMQPRKTSEANTGSDKGGGHRAG